MNMRWLIYLLLTGLILATIWRYDFSDNPDPSWTKCTESLLVQTLTGTCTLRYEGETKPS